MKFDYPIPSAQDLYTLLKPFGGKKPIAREVYERTALAYSSEGRFYHTLAHVGQVLGVAKFLSESGDCHFGSDSHLALLLAAWFHDVVYDPRRDDNEAQSVVWMKKALRPFGIPVLILEETVNLILATRNHIASPDHLSTQILLDADLSILGAPPEIYRQYAVAIRQEYNFVSDNAYRSGRRAVLERFLARPQIFHHPITFAALEKQARGNMMEEIHT